MDVRNLILHGRDTIPGLARVYPQLFLMPGTPDAEERYRDIVLCGQDAPTRSLAHFAGDPKDSCLPEETPAGAVPVITLHRRADFELFLQIMANRCTPVPIPRTQGAAILDGVINWTRIRDHKEEFVRLHGPGADWEGEFARFTADKANFKDALIVLSVGPYSAVSAEIMDLDEREWLSVSHTIRKVHECTHFICRRFFPDKKDAVWDELVADAAGIAAAFGRFDPAVEERFLGIKGGRYTGGRLENYLDGDGDRRERLDALARKIHNVLPLFESIGDAFRGRSPYELAIRLEEEIGCWKQP